MTQYSTNSIGEPLGPLERARIEKAAQDAGFDLSVTVSDEWLVFRSSAFPQAVGVSAQSDATYRVGFDDISAGEHLAAEFGLQHKSSAPPWALGLVGIPDYPALHRLLARLAAMWRLVAGAGLREFEVKSQRLPDSTEATRLVVQRVGQDIFRAALLEYWGGRCAVSGLAIPGLLRASHIKPWADCASDAERLDVFNGLLLAPHLDALFDGGWVTFLDSGQMRVSDALDAVNCKQLGITGDEVVNGLTEGHRGYLAWHRQRCFRTG